MVQFTLYPFLLQEAFPDFLSWLRVDPILHSLKYHCHCSVDVALASSWGFRKDRALVEPPLVLSAAASTSPAPSRSDIQLLT